MDSGWLRLLIILGFLTLSGIVLNFGFILILKGVKGEFTIAVEHLKGLNLYIASVSPGILFIIGGVLMLWKALPATLKNLMPQS